MLVETCSCPRRARHIRQRMLETLAMRPRLKVSRFSEAVRRTSSPDPFHVEPHRRLRRRSVRNLADYVNRNFLISAR